MDKSKGLRIASAVISVIAAAVGIAGDAINKKNNDIEMKKTIEEEVAKAMNK